jgi:hypothetical protein
MTLSMDAKARSKRETHLFTHIGLWPISEVATPLIEVRLVEHNGSDLLALKLSQFDPKAT